MQKRKPQSKDAKSRGKKEEIVPDEEPVPEEPPVPTLDELITKMDAVVWEDEEMDTPHKQRNFCRKQSFDNVQIKHFIEIVQELQQRILSDVCKEQCFADFKRILMERNESHKPFSIQQIESIVAYLTKSFFAHYRLLQATWTSDFRVIDPNSEAEFVPDPEPVIEPEPEIPIDPATGLPFPTEEELAAIERKQQEDKKKTSQKRPFKAKPTPKK